MIYNVLQKSKSNFLTLGGLLCNIYYMSKRKYTKKSPYWDQFSQVEASDLSALSDSSSSTPISAGESYYESAASSSKLSESKASYSRSTGGKHQGTRRNRIYSSSKKNRFANIDSGMLPYSYDSNGINIRDSIELCQKAYANIAVFRNAVDVMSEFANSNIYLEGGTKKSRDFIYK